MPVQGYDYGSFKCKECKKRKRAWKGSISYKEKLCPECLEKKFGQAELLKRSIKESK